MNNATRLAFLLLTAVPVTLLLLGGKSPKPAVAAVEQIKRGEYLVQLGGCSDCHTPKKMGDRGPEDDLTRFLAGHPQDDKLPPPPYLPPGAVVRDDRRAYGLVWILGNQLCLELDARFEHRARDLDRGDVHQGNANGEALWGFAGYPASDAVAESFQTDG